MSVRVLLAKAIGLLLFMRAAPKLYLLVSILHYDMLILVTVHKGSTEEGLADPGFKAMEDCICQEVPVTFGKLFSQKNIILSERCGKKGCR